MALQFQSRLFTSRAVSERDMIVGNIIEEVNLFLVQQ